MRFLWLGIFLAQLAVLGSPPAISAGARGFQHEYVANVVRVIDGDTLEISVPLWQGLIQITSFRIANINTPEKVGSPCERTAARAAIVFVEYWLSVGNGVVIISDLRPDKFAGRVNGDLRRSDGEDLAAALLLIGHARKYTGGKRAPWCG